MSLLVIDYGAGDQTLGHMTLFADYMNVPRNTHRRCPSDFWGCGTM